MNTIKIEVTQKDIDKGKQGNCRSCPIARAVRRAVPSSTDVYVSADYIAIYKDGSILDADTPEDAVRFIKLFDCHKGLVLPATFELNAEDRIGFRVA